MTQTDEFPPMNLGPGNPWGRVIRERLDEIARLQDARELFVRGNNRALVSSLDSLSSQLDSLSQSGQVLQERADDYLDQLQDLMDAQSRVDLAAQEATVTLAPPSILTTGFAYTSGWVTRGTWSVIVPPNLTKATVIASGYAQSVSPSRGNLRLQIQGQVSQPFYWGEGVPVGFTTTASSVSRGQFGRSFAVTPGGTVTVNLQVMHDNTIIPGTTPGGANPNNRTILSPLVVFTV